MPTNTSALSVISSHFEKFASCPAPKPQVSRLSSNSTDSNNNIDLHLSSNAKLILMTKIEFHKAETATSNAFTDTLKSKYVNLTQIAAQNGLSNGNASHHNDSKSPVADSRPLVNNHVKTPVEEKEPSTSTTAVQPKKVLYPPERIQLKWCRPVPIGAGLINCGNTCFLNSTLQALTHTAPLYNYLVSEQHILNCKVNSFCMLCEMERHMVRSYGSNSTRPFEPESILRKLTVIAKHLRPGRQEDAHEFLRFAVEKMQQACLNGLQKLDPEVKETTAMNAIFGGSIKSTVICQTCHTRSDKIDPIMDLCLELKQASTLHQALEHFVKPETLVGENAYKCPSCKKPQPARKTLSINRPPNILTFQLKRFGVGHSLFGGAKITKQIEFHERFNLQSFMSLKTGPEIPYSLYAVVVHEGLSANSGHYYAYVKHNSQWYMMNDTVVKTVSVRQVLGSQAYILFYIRDLDNGESSSAPPTPAKQSQFTSPTSSKLVSNTPTPPVYKPATIPSSALPIKMVIRLPQQNGSTPHASSTTPSSSAPKITSYSSQPLIAKRPAQVLTSSSSNAPAKVPSVTSPVQNSPSLTVTPSKPPASVVTATRPLVNGFETSSSDDEDSNRLVIDELAPGGSSSVSFSKPERQKSPPVIKFVPPKLITVPEPPPPPAVEHPSKLPASEPEPSEDGEVQGDESVSTSSSKKRRKHRSGDNDSGGEQEEEGEHHRHHRRHKKHRHSRKRRHEDGEEEQREDDANGEVDNNDDGDSESKKAKKKKSKKHRHRSEGSESAEKNGEEEEEWVEKEPAPTQFPSVPPLPPPSKPPEVSLPSPTGRARYPLPPSYPQQQQPYVLGSHVTSWDGGLNSIDSQVIPTHNNHNGHYDDNEKWKRDFDDELDAGRLKKAKKPFSAKAEFDSLAPSHLPPVFQQANYSQNAFQAVQNARNYEREDSAPSQNSNNRPRSGASSHISTPDGAAVMNDRHNVHHMPQQQYSHYNGHHQMNGDGNDRNYYGNTNNNDDGRYQQSNYNDKFSRTNNNYPRTNNRYDSPIANSNGYGGRKDGAYHQHPASEPRTYGGNNNWRGGGGGGRGFFRRQQWSFQQ